VPYDVRRVPKYRNIRTELGGVTYDSKFEASFAAELNLRLRAKDIKKVERQVRLELFSGRFHICDYKIDFVVTHNDGVKEYIEVKGVETRDWKLKWKLLEAQMDAEVKLGTVKLTVVKERSRWTMRDIKGRTKRSVAPPLPIVYD
jgi:hypothetical protein